MTDARGRLLFIFLDGVGLGAADSAANPFVTSDTPALSSLLGAALTDRLPEVAVGGLVFRSLDASLGQPGLPQSATGQTALLTGLNAADAMGGHYGPWPGPTLRNLLDQGNLFSRTAAAGKQATIANMYPPGYFDALKRRRTRVNAPVHAALGAGLQLRRIADFERQDAVSADLTGRYLQQIVPGSRQLSAPQSGRELRQLALRHDFTFFDFWLSDQVGHRGTLEEAERLVSELDAFLGTALPDMGDGLTVVLTSDHGNLEDKTLRTHTYARVPLLATGPGAGAFTAVSDLTGVAPVALDLLAL